MAQAACSSRFSVSAAIGSALAITAAIAFSAKAIFVKLAYRYGVDPMTLLMLRMSFSLPFFVGIALWQHFRANVTRICRNDLMAILVLGAVGNYLAAALDFIGLQYISASFERLILYLYPTLVVVLSALLLRRSIRKREVATMIISYAGIILVFSQDVTGGRPGALAGTGFIFGSALAYASYLIGSERMIPRIGSIRFTALAMTVTSLTCMTQYVATRSLAALDQPAPVYWLAASMALLSTVLPAFLLSAGIRRVGARSAATLSLIGPISTILLANIFLAETITGAQLAGTALVLGGVFGLRDANNG